MAKPFPGPLTPGPREYPLSDTLCAKVGIGVCWDRHRLFIARELARSGVKIVLRPVDDDFERGR